VNADTERQRGRSSNLQSFVLGEELCDLGVDRLFLGQVGDLVAALYQIFDLCLDDLLFCLRLLWFADVVFVVHGRIVQPPDRLLKREKGIDAERTDTLLY